MNRNPSVDHYINKQDNWQQSNLNLFRDLVHKVSPDVKEAIKWNVPVFVVSKKTLFTMASFKELTKYSFIYNGAAISDQSLFNNGLESKKNRSIDVRESENIDKKTLESIIEESISSI